MSTLAFRHCYEVQPLWRIRSKQQDSSQTSGSKGKTKRKVAKGKKFFGESPNGSNPSIEPIAVRTRSSQSKNSIGTNCSEDKKLQINP
ncbi:unnamed protein product [Prunus armeniaca]|uniref:Uncharacterized protein n=1 Tax=Prunus armeniaca TaxID=36596 RepID=A0A6J5TP53_PRUAR|nr:unnamed protein product [Prunus armeniaca]